MMATKNQPAIAGTYDVDRSVNRYVDRYVAAVGSMLPAERRKDIEAEIRANLLDEIDARANASGFPGAASEQTVLEVLQRYPRPLEMAQRYGAVQSLIGPALYNSFVSVLKLVLTVVLTVNVVVALMRVMGGHSGFSLVETIGGIASSLFVAGGIVTLIFAIIERSPGAAEEIAGEIGADLDGNKEKGWDPRKLPEVTDRNRISTGDLVGDIITSLVTILWLNLYVSPDGSMPIYVGEWIQAPIFSTTFMSYVPLLTAFWAIELLVYLVVLAQQRWTLLTRVIALASLAGTVVVSTIMLNAGDLAANAMWEWGVRLGVAIVILITACQIAGHLWTMYKNGREGSARSAAALA